MKLYLVAFIHICHLSFIVLYFYGLSTGHYRNDYLKTEQNISPLYFTNSLVCFRVVKKMCRHELQIVAQNYFIPLKSAFSPVFFHQKGVHSNKALGSIHGMWTIILRHYSAFKALERLVISHNK